MERIGVIRMPSPIFNAMNNGQAPNQGGPFDLVRQYNNFRQDPFTFMLRTKGIDIPKEYANDPKGAVQYLLNNGQMTNQQLDYLKSMARQMNIPIN